MQGYFAPATAQRNKVAGKGDRALDRIHRPLGDRHSVQIS
jgi:hypothetical protein